MENKTAGEYAMRFFKTGPGQYGEGDLFLGKRDLKIEEEFLLPLYKKMPRTLLR